MEKNCFVIMPIKTEGSEEHSHFKGLYDVILKPTVTSLGFEVLRSDEVQRSGAITKDIILRLAEADLVIVDITDLNPNVFYEMGVRHSLRSQGTVMLVDELRTSDIPFDLSAYRVIKFKGELTGFERLRREILGFVEAFLAGDADRRDNPVHDALPALPLDALHSANRSSEGELRERLAKAERQIREFEQLYGLPTPNRSGTQTPLSVVDEALSEASEGLLPSDLLQQAEMAVSQRDQKAFLAAVKRAFERKTLRLSARQFRMLASYSGRFELDQVTGSIYEYALSLYPGEKELTSAYLRYAAHSQVPALREKARQEMLNKLEIVVTERSVEVPGHLREFATMGVMLDAYYADGMVEPALRIAKAAAEKFSSSTIVARNYARALEAARKSDEALAWFRRAVVSCSDADDQSCVWLGNTLHNVGRTVDALEAYLRACLLDPDDATCFSQVADELAWCLKDEQAKSVLGGKSRPLPEGIGASEFEVAVKAAISCTDFAQSDWDRCRTAAKRVRVSVDHLAKGLSRSVSGNDSVELRLPTIAERLEFASRLYNVFRSELTDGSMVNGNEQLGSQPS